MTVLLALVLSQVPQRPEPPQRPPVQLVQAPPDLSKLPPFKANAPTLVICSADRDAAGNPFTCIPCLKLAAAMKTDATLATALTGFNVRHVKNDFAEFKRLGVSTFPTLVILDGNGNASRLWVGFMDGWQASLAAWLRPPAAQTFAPPVFRLATTQTC